MKLTTVFTRSAFAAIALLNISVASAIAEPIVVQRGSHGGSVVVQSDNIPVEATRQLKQSKSSRAVIQRGPRGAFQLGRKPVNRLITRGPNGAGFITNR